MNTTMTTEMGRMSDQHINTEPEQADLGENMVSYLEYVIEQHRKLADAVNGLVELWNHGHTVHEGSDTANEVRNALTAVNAVMGS